MKKSYQHGQVFAAWAVRSSPELERLLAGLLNDEIFLEVVEEGLHVSQNTFGEPGSLFAGLELHELTGLTMQLNMAKFLQPLFCSVHLGFVSRYFCLEGLCFSGVKSARQAVGGVL